MLKFDMKILKKKISGFSLVELLISMVIFMLVLLVLSTLFMRVLDLSVAQDVKNSFLTQIQNIALNIKNTFRNAKQVLICPAENNNTRLVMKLNNDDVKIIRYTEQRLTELTIIFNQFLSGSQASGSVNYCQYSFEQSMLPVIQMHSANVQINSFFINTKSDMHSVQIIYITINACSRDLLPRVNLYHCDGSNFSEYRYSFAVVARNK